MKKLLNILMLILLVLSLGAYKKASTEIIEAKGEIVSLKSANANLVYEIQNYPVKEVYQLAEEIYGIEAELLMAIQILETGNYTSEVYKKYNNTYGGQINGKFIKYSSTKESTMELARLLRYRYLNEGLTTLTEIGAKFCPTDENWASKVNQIYLELMEE